MPPIPPKSLIYDVTIEQFNGHRPARVFIRFERESPTRIARHIIDIFDAISNKPITLNPCNHYKIDPLDKIDEAIDMLIWAVQNDPDPVDLELLAFLTSI